MFVVDIWLGLYQKVVKIAENIVWDCKIEVYCGGYTVQKAIDSLRKYIICWQHLNLLMVLHSSENLNLHVT